LVELISLLDQIVTLLASPNLHFLPAIIEKLQYSVHVSIGVQVLTMYDVLARALEQLVYTDAVIRDAVPVLQNGSGLEKDTFYSQCRDLLESTLTPNRMAEAAHELLDRAVSQAPRTCMKDVLAIARQPMSLSLDTRVCLPMQLPSRCTMRVGDKVRVLMNGTEFEIPGTHAEMANFLVEQHQCRVGDLPGVDGVVKLAFVEHLLNQSCLQVVENAIAAPSMH